MLYGSTSSQHAVEPESSLLLYSPRCREGFFSETGLPAWPILGTLTLSCSTLRTARSISYTGQACSVSFLEEFFSETRALEMGAPQYSSMSTAPGFGGGCILDAAK